VTRVMTVNCRKPNLPYSFRRHLRA